LLGERQQGTTPALDVGDERTLAQDDDGPCLAPGPVPALAGPRRPCEGCAVGVGRIARGEDETCAAAADDVAGGDVAGCAPVCRASAGCASADGVTRSPLGLRASF